MSSLQTSKQQQYYRGDQETDENQYNTARFEANLIDQPSLNDLLRVTEITGSPFTPTALPTGRNQPSVSMIASFIEIDRFVGGRPNLTSVLEAALRIGVVDYDQDSDGEQSSSSLNFFDQ